MCCYASNIYTTGFVHVTELNSMQNVYLLPDGVDAKTALSFIIMEYLSEMRQSSTMASVSTMIEMVKESTFASKSIAHTKNGHIYHKWIENPYQNCFYTERRNFVTNVVDNFNKIERQVSDLEEILPITCIY